MIVYGDILLALNWWLDFLLLLGVRRTLGGGARPWRLALGALGGALSCFTLFLPPRNAISTERRRSSSVTFLLITSRRR